jgi:prolycopene isomerase
VEAVEALQKKFPAEASSIRNFFDFVWQFANEASSIHYLTDPEASKEKYPVFSKYALMNTQDVLDEYFRDPTLKAVISIYSGYAGLPPTKLPFMTMAGLIWIYGEFYPYYIKGGSQALSNAILDTFIKSGGRTKFNCTAKKLTVKEGSIQGVLTESGEMITAPCVVSNASVISSFVDLMDPEDVPAETLQMLGSRTIGPSAFNVYCGLDRSPEDLGIEICSQFVVRAQPWNSSKLPASLAPPKGMLMTCYNLSDSDASPAGTSQVALCTLHYADDWISIPPAQYAETKYAYAEYMLELAEEACPGFRAAIEEVEVATPLTMMRFVGHPGGAIYGFDQYAKDSNIFVQPPQSIEGLYFAGCWVDTGGFQPTLESGVNAAETIMQQIKF